MTKDNFKSPATHVRHEGPGRTKLYIFTVQALTSATGEGRETHEYQETLGGSFYEFLSGSTISSSWQTSITATAERHSLAPSRTSIRRW